MIKTVTVRAGASPYARAAQNYGFELAKRFDARLRVAVAWRHPDSESEGKPREPVEGAEGASSPEVNGIVECASSQGIRAEAAFHGEGTFMGLMAEARISDLLVLGIPTEADAMHHKDAGVLYKEEFPILRKADCSILAVSQPSEKLDNILVSYQGEEFDKSALRMAGWLGEKFGAVVHVVSVKARESEAAELCGLARQYLEAFDLKEIRVISYTGNGATTTKLLQDAKSTHADLLILASDTWNVFEGVFMGRTAEQLVNAAEIPVCIAR